MGRRLRGTLILLAAIAASLALAGPLAYAGDAGDEYVLDIPPKPDASGTGTTPGGPSTTYPSTGETTGTGSYGEAGSEAAGSGGSSADESGKGGDSAGSAGSAGTGDDLARLDAGKTGSSVSVPEIAAGAGGDGGVPLLVAALVAIAAAGGFVAWRRNRRASARPSAA